VIDGRDFGILELGNFGIAFFDSSGSKSYKEIGLICFIISNNNI